MGFLKLIPGVCRAPEMTISNSPYVVQKCRTNWPRDRRCRVDIVLTARWN